MTQDHDGGPDGQVAPPHKNRRGVIIGGFAALVVVIMVLAIMLVTRKSPTPAAAAAPSVAANAATVDSQAAAGVVAVARTSEQTKTSPAAASAPPAISAVLAPTADPRQTVDIVEPKGTLIHAKFHRDDFGQMSVPKLEAIPAGTADDQGKVPAAGYEFRYVALSWHTWAYPTGTVSGPKGTFSIGVPGKPPIVEGKLWATGPDPGHEQIIVESVSVATGAVSTAAATYVTWFEDGKPVWVMNLNTGVADDAP